MTEKKFKEELLNNIDTIKNDATELKYLITCECYVEAARLADSLCGFLKDMHSFIENERRNLQ